jgi:hypothetical protein
MEVDADDFGKLFASMNSEQQIAVLKSMLDHMMPHQMQWDYIAIELEKPENTLTLSRLTSLISGMSNG